jgi:hypothetical protein
LDNLEREVFSMQTAPITAPHAAGNTAKKPPPLWFVTNGVVTVGPVTTNLLVRGVLHEHVPSDCMVRERSWTSFRNVERIREISALRREQALHGTVVVEETKWQKPEPPRNPFRELENELLLARDSGEVLLHCLMETMRATSAWVGAVHRRRPPQPGFVTTCVSGPGTARRLGRQLDEDDPVLLLAAQGGTLCEPPRAAAASGRVRDRLGALPACDGVAMAPILCCGRLYAVIELGRPDHAFRDADLQALRTAVGLAADRLGIVRNSPASRTLWEASSSN